MNKRIYLDGWEDENPKFKLPWMIDNLLNDGYVVWFAKGRYHQAEVKTGQQFWLENGELYTKNVDPYHRKELLDGFRAWRKLKHELESYARCNFNFKLIGDDCWHSHYDSEWDVISLENSVKRALKYTQMMPAIPQNISMYDLIEVIMPLTTITFHKRKQANINAFRAGDAKAVMFKWLNKRYSNAIIVPEFGIGGVWGKNSIVDLAVFDEKKMIFVEIKAETDSFARVQRQLESSSLTADEVWLALFEDKHIPSGIPLHVGIVSFNRDGKIKIIQKAKQLKQDRTQIGHIWTTELHDSFSCYKGASTWIKNLRGGLEELTKVAKDILGKNSRQFTINTLRDRHYLEYVWRRDQLLSGNAEAISIARGGQNHSNKFYKHFLEHYKGQRNRLSFPSMAELAVKEFEIPLKQKKKNVSV